MEVSTFTPILKFANIRDAKPKEFSGDIILVMPETDLVTGIVTINDSDSTNEQKLNDTNTLLQNYIDSSDFIKTTTLFGSVVDVETPSDEGLKLMYDNLIVRLLTKSNTNAVYGMLLKYIKEFAANLNSSTIDKVRIIIPDKITFSFLEFEGQNEYNPPSEVERNDLVKDINTYTGIKKQINEAKENNIVKFSTDNVHKKNIAYQSLFYYFKKSTIVVEDASSALESKFTELDTKAGTNFDFPQTNEVFSGNTSLKANAAKNTATTLGETNYIKQLQELVNKAIDSELTEINEIEIVPESSYNNILSVMNFDELTLVNAEKIADEKLNEIYKKSDVLFPGRTYSLVGGRWQEITSTVNAGYIVPDESGADIMVYSHGCYLKYPVQVADLRVVEQQSVGYLPADIAHINNTQKGETNTRVTRRLKKVESFESLITDVETSHETDSQSTERFSIETDARHIEKEEMSFNAATSVSASYGGTVSTSLSAGFSAGTSEESSNGSAQQYAKEIFKRVVDRVSNRTIAERSLKTFEEFEETVTHVIDNTKDETKSFVYRWLNKLVRGTLKNYGKRLIFQVDVAHPASYYIARMMNEKPQFNVPDNPRTMKVGSKTFNPEMIDRNNHLSLGALYGVKLEAPPLQRIIVSETFNASNDAGIVYQGKLVPIKKGYSCTEAIVTYTYATAGVPLHDFIMVLVGNSGIANWDNHDNFYFPAHLWLANEKENLSVSIFQGRGGYIMNIEIHCDLAPEGLSEWQTKCYYDLIDGYDKLKSQADSKLNEFDPNAPGLPPEKKRELVKEELKKEAMRKMFRCNPFWINDNFQVGKEYNLNCCIDSANAEKVRFLETVFDWRNMTYQMHPYYYSNKSQWNKLLDLEDDDPHFDAFLKSSFATVHVPVHRDKLKEIAACNFIVNNSIGNYETIPEGLKDLLLEISEEPVSNFTYDLDGNVIAEPKATVDLGIFTIPTSLVILECGVQDGVKPIGFPQADAIDPDVVIPKQYSPAIISDSCDNIIP